MAANNRRNQKCQNCGQTVESMEDLNYHWLENHNKKIEQSLQPAKNLGKTMRIKTIKSTRTTVASSPAIRRVKTYATLAQTAPVKFDGGYSVESYVKKSSLDGSSSYYDKFYEGSRLGSHPSHDDYGDESFA